MNKIALVTDSTSDLPSKFALDNGVHIIPMKVRFGEEEFRDEELQGEEFYRRLTEAHELPKTSQPSPEEFIRMYSELFHDYQEIISIHLSSRLSGTINAARLAAEQVKGKIHIVDSKTISLGMALMVQDAARQLKKGIGAEQVVAGLAKTRKNIETMFTVNTLEYLQKGGRIGRVQGLMGSILNIKPLIRVGDDGVYHTYDRLRSQERAFRSMVNGFKELAHSRKPVQLAVAHGAAIQAATQLKEALENAFQIPACLFAQVGSTVGVHTGPGTIGAALQYE